VRKTVRFGRPARPHIVASGATTKEFAERYRSEQEDSKPQRMYWDGWYWFEYGGRRRKELMPTEHSIPKEIERQLAIEASGD